MKQYEASGRTVEEAISAALAQSGLSIAEVSVEILEEGSKGLFGLFGSRQAKVRLTRRESEGSSDTLDLFKDSLRDRSQKPQKEAQPQREPKREEKQVVKPAQPRAPKEPAKPQAEKPAKPAKAAKPARAAQADKAEQEAKPAKAQQGRERRPQKQRQASKPAQEAREAREPREPRERPLAALPADFTPPPPAPQADRALPEGQAQEFLQDLTRLMGMQIAVSVSTDEEGHVFANMEGDPQGILIGRRGETLDALQYLCSLHINKGRDGYIRVTLDSEGYRKKREEALIRLANRMANRARKTGRRVNMEPMNPYERRIFHSALQSTPGIATHSEGEDPNRHVVITPIQDDSAQNQQEEA